MAGIGFARDFTSSLQSGSLFTQALHSRSVLSFKICVEQNETERITRQRKKRKEQEIVKTRIAILIGLAALVAGAVILAAAHGAQEQGQRPSRREGMLPPPPPFGVPDVEH